MRFKKSLFVLTLGLIVAPTTSFFVSSNEPSQTSQKSKNHFVTANLTDFVISGPSEINFVMGSRQLEQYSVVNVTPNDATYNIQWSINFNDQNDEEDISILTTLGNLVISKDLSYGIHVIDVVATDTITNVTKTFPVVINAMYAAPANFVLLNSNELVKTIKTTPNQDQTIEYIANVSNEDYVDPNLEYVWSLEGNNEYFAMATSNNHGLLTINKNVLPGVYNFKIVCSAKNYAAINDWSATITVEQKKPSIVSIIGPNNINAKYGKSGYVEYVVAVDEGSNIAPSELTWQLLDRNNENIAPQGIKIDPHETNKASAVLTWNDDLKTIQHDLIIRVSWLNDQNEWKHSDYSVILNVGKQDHLNMLWLLLIPITMIIILGVALFIRNRGKVNDLN